MIRTLFHLLSRGAEDRPDHPALRMDGVDLSYSELTSRTNAVARCLVDQGIKRSDRVSIFMARSFDSMAAIFGVMQAGGVYVPMDIDAPFARNLAMLRNAGVQYIVCDASQTELVGRIAGELSELRFVIGIDEGVGTASIGWSRIGDDFDIALPDLGVIETDLAVMFHTSGTTGTPKGVVHSHRSMLSNVEWAVRQFDLSPDDRFSTVTAHSFELSWLELYASKAVQATAILAPEQAVRFGPTELVALTSRERVSVWCSVPSVLIRLSERGSPETADLSSLRTVHFAGERFPTKQLRRLMEQVPHPRYVNMLGTTETHICAFWEVPALPDDMTAAIPIGKACDHVNLYALGPDNGILADGETGELAVRGPSLMEGYWQLPDRTDQAMADVEIGPDLSARCYRTGDLVRKDGNGDFHIIGRANRRIKVQGHLVDLDEVEAVMISEPRIREAAAIEAEIEGVSHLHAAVVLTSGTMTLSPAEMRVYVAQSLPTYAVPERVEVFDALPRTGSGKIDRRALQDSAEAAEIDRAARSRPASHSSADTSTNELMSALRAYIVSELLTDPVTDLGEYDELLESGLLDSISVVRLVSYLEREFSIEVPNNDFVPANFQSLDTIRTLVERQKGQAETRCVGR